ncbi:DNA helicase [Tanacetum coccineum]
MTSFLKISRRPQDKYHNLKDDDIMKNIFNSGRYKDKVGLKILEWIISEEMKHMEHYRMYAEVFGLDVPLTQRSTRLTPPAPVPTVDKADEMILQDTLQVSLAEHKSREEQEARENVKLVKEHLASIEIEKMLIMNGKVPDYAETWLLWSLSIFIRSSVIWERVHDFQLGIESYQQKVNLTAPTISFLGVEKHKMFSIIYKPVHGIIHKNSKKEKKVMRHSEIHKFYDATLNRVLEGLRSYNNDVKYGYIQKDLTKDEVEYLKLFEEEIEVSQSDEEMGDVYKQDLTLGLLGDDKEWDITLEESIVSASSAEIAMKDDIPANVLEATGILIYHVNTPELQGYILYELEAILNGFGKSIKDFGLPPPLERLLKDLRNKLLIEERNYKRDLLMQDAAHFGETGKTFLWKTIISWFRSQGKIVLAVALSGIASLLLPAGRTTHSRFKLPLDLTDESVFHAKKHSQLANLLIETVLFIWDEAPMNDRRCFKALDRTLRDLMNASEILFGGKTIVLGGDFRQTLPVKKGAAKEELIHASIAESYLWLHFKICKLKENMRLMRSGLGNEEREHFKFFAKWLINVGNGEIGKPDEDNDEDTSWITIP